MLNYELAALLAEAGYSREALARQVARQARQDFGLRLAYDYRSVGRWLRGSVPEPPIVALFRMTPAWGAREVK